jgi:hypothetical protein
VTEHLGERVLICVPVPALPQVCREELPVVLGQVDAPQEASALLLLGEVEEDLHDPEAVVAHVARPLVDGVVAAFPDVMSA